VDQNGRNDSGDALGTTTPMKERSFFLFFAEQSLSQQYPTLPHLVGQSDTRCDVGLAALLQYFVHLGLQFHVSLLFAFPPKKLDNKVS
jgi:hypothetical protein